MWFRSVWERVYYATLIAVVAIVSIVFTNPLATNPTRRVTTPYHGTGTSTEVPSAPPTTTEPTAPPPVTGNKVVWAAGDNCDDDFTSMQTTNVEGCKWVGDMIKADSATNRFLLLGDSQYDEGEAINFSTYYDVGMGKQQIFSGSSESIWDRTIAAVGNHEYLTPNATPFFNYFGTARSGDPTKGYFMTDLGKWRVITLNSNCSEVGGCAATNPQGVFAISALDAATAAGDSTIVIYHHPPFSDGEGYAPGTTSGVILWQIAYDHGADIVLTGHDHEYQRFGPLSRTGTPLSGGPQFFVSGAGGRGNNAMSTLSGTDRTLYEWAKIGSGGTSTQKEPGALRLVLSDNGTYTFAFKTNGSADGIFTRDTGSGSSR